MTAARLPEGWSMVGQPGEQGYSFTTEPFKWQLGDGLIGGGASRDQTESSSTVFLTLKRVRIRVPPLWAGT